MLLVSLIIIIIPMAAARTTALAFIVHRRRALSLVHAHINIRYVVNRASLPNNWLDGCDVLGAMMIDLRLHCLLIYQVSPRLSH